MMDMLKNETNGLYSFNHIRSLILLITLPLLSSIKISEDVKPVDSETGKVYFIPQPESVKIGVGPISISRMPPASPQYFMFVLNALT